MTIRPVLREQRLEEEVELIGVGGFVEIYRLPGKGYRKVATDIMTERAIGRDDNCER